MPIHRSVARTAGPLAVLLATVAAAGPVSFEVTLDPAARATPYAGRVYVAVAPAGAEQEPRQAMHAWIDPPPLFAIDVPAMAPGASVVVERGCLAHPVPPDRLEPGSYTAQAVLRLDRFSARAGEGPEDLVSGTVDFSVTDGDEAVRVALTVDHAVGATPFEQTDRVRLVEFVSPALTTFHGFPYPVQVGVVLPERFDERADESFPVIYFGTGFGGDHTFAHDLAASPLLRGPGAGDVVWVVPNPVCFRGHSVFANSANNGPWLDVLVDEIAPRVDEGFRGAGPEHRYITGISSGGWMALWVQMNAADDFAGCWSHVPDPVDLHHFQTVDVYADNANIYTASEGGEAPIGRRNGEVFLTARDFIARETVHGPGGQMHSFEAVWSPRGPDSTPLPLWDRQTGEIDPAVAQAWRAYDVAHLVRTSLAETARRLGDRVHVYGGGADTFFLERAVPPLAEAFKAAGAEAVIEVVPGLPHTLYPPGHADMMETVRTRWANRAAP